MKDKSGVVPDSIGQANKSLCIGCPGIAISIHSTCHFCQTANITAGTLPSSLLQDSKFKMTSQQLNTGLIQQS
jgi:hypothetical protein